MHFVERLQRYAMSNGEPCIMDTVSGSIVTMADLANAFASHVPLADDQRGLLIAWLAQKAPSVECGWEVEVHNEFVNVNGGTLMCTPDEAEALAFALLAKASEVRRRV